MRGVTLKRGMLHVGGGIQLFGGCWFSAVFHDWGGIVLAFSGGAFVGGDRNRVKDLIWEQSAGEDSSGEGNSSPDYIQFDPDAFLYEMSGDLLSSNRFILAQ